MAIYSNVFWFILNYDGNSGEILNFVHLAPARTGLNAAQEVVPKALQRPLESRSVCRSLEYTVSQNNVPRQFLGSGSNRSNSSRF